jgi:hypothetical protein
MARDAAENISPPQAPARRGKNDGGAENIFP